MGNYINCVSTFIVNVELLQKEGDYLKRKKKHRRLATSAFLQYLQDVRTYLLVVIVAYAGPETEPVDIGGDILAEGARTAHAGVSVVEADALELRLGETPGSAVLQHDPQDESLINLGAHHRMHLPVTIVDEVCQHAICMWGGETY